MDGRPAEAGQAVEDPPCPRVDGSVGPFLRKFTWRAIVRTAGIGTVAGLALGLLRRPNVGAQARVADGHPLISNADRRRCLENHFKWIVYLIYPLKVLQSSCVSEK